MHQHRPEASGGATGTRADADQLLLDEAFERALASWEDGILLSAPELVPDRPDLAEQAESILSLVREIAVVGPSPDPLPTVPGYEVLSELGRGAMGAVYLARQERLGGRAVALKVLPAGAAVSSRARDRFQAEANAVARLRHPHIVTVHDVVRDGTLVAFAMEPVDGPSLHAVIEHVRASGQPPRDADVRELLGAGTSALGDVPYWMTIARIGAAVARALEAVHGAGLLHRDVKPSNILLRRDGTPLLSDFGLVHDPESGVVTRAEGFVGTPGYAPPEQLSGGIGAADSRSDVYALGATLFHALALRTPFGPGSPVELIALIDRGPAPLPKEVPRDLATIIGKAMAPAARDRYASAAAMADDLDRLLADRPILARRAGAVSRAVKLMRRNRQAFWGTIGGALVALLVVGAATMGFVIMPRWAQQARERAWLALLDPRDATNFANAGFWQTTFPGPPRCDLHLAHKALAEYEKAVRLQPWDERTELERDVILAMISMGKDGRTPLRMSEDLMRRAPLACRWLEQWTRASAEALPPALPPNALPPDELIAIGLMSYLSAEMHPAVEAWLRLEHLGDPGPFVRGGLGLFFIYGQEPGRAYPRLEYADRSFRSVSFLRAAHAEAALGVGDTDLAALLLNQARELPQRDEGQLVRITTLLDLARGDAEGGLDRFRRWFFFAPYGHNAVGGYQVGTWMAARGDEARALGVLSIAVGTSPPKPVARLFLSMAERWWDALSEPQRLDVVERAIAERGLPHPWGELNVPAAYWRVRSCIAGDPRFAELRGLLHAHPLEECGKRLDPYRRWNSPEGEQFPPPQGEELRRLAREVLGVDSERAR